MSNTSTAQTGSGTVSSVKLDGPASGNVSKSDQQLFGDLAPAVRQYGIAADAAEKAHRLLLDGLGDEKVSPPDDGEPTDRQALITASHELREHTQHRHRCVALWALREQSSGSDQKGTDEGGGWIISPLTEESLAEAFSRHGVRRKLVVAEDLKLRASRITGAQPEVDPHAEPGSWKLV